MEHREKHLVYRAGLVPYIVEHDGIHETNKPRIWDIHLPIGKGKGGG
jgi:hypothetical protein